MNVLYSDMKLDDKMYENVCFGKLTKSRTVEEISNGNFKNGMLNDVLDIGFINMLTTKKSIYITYAHIKP